MNANFFVLFLYIQWVSSLYSSINVLNLLGFIWQIKLLKYKNYTLKVEIYILDVFYILTNILGTLIQIWLSNDYILH